MPALYGFRTAAVGASRSRLSPPAPGSCWGHVVESGLVSARQAQPLGYITVDGCTASAGAYVAGIIDRADLTGFPYHQRFLSV
jgi:hypothetical protein